VRKIGLEAGYVDPGVGTLPAPFLLSSLPIPMAHWGINRQVMGKVMVFVMNSVGMSKHGR